MGRVFFNTRKNIDKLTGAYTVLATDTGKDFILSATGNTITLPSVANMGEGWNCRFTVGATLTANWIITAPAAILQGSVHELVTATGPVITNKQTLTLVFGSGTVGDFYELMFDGTNIYVTGSCTLDGAVTV